MKAPLSAAHDSESEGAIRCGCGSGSGPNTRVSNYVYLGTGAKGGDPPKNDKKNKNNQLLGLCSGGNHGGGLHGPCGEVPLTPNPDSNPVTNHCKDQLYNHSLEKTRIRPEIWPVNLYRGGATVHWRKLGSVLRYGQ